MPLLSTSAEKATTLKRVRGAATNLAQAILDVLDRSKAKTGPGLVGVAL